VRGTEIGFELKQSRSQRPREHWIDGNESVERRAVSFDDDWIVGRRVFPIDAVDDDLFAKGDVSRIHNDTVAGLRDADRLLQRPQRPLPAGHLERLPAIAVVAARVVDVNIPRGRRDGRREKSRHGRKSG
jgi:hypothetical protein